jgi:hypothetical protein
VIRRYEYIYSVYVSMCVHPEFSQSVRRFLREHSISHISLRLWNSMKNIDTFRSGPLILCDGVVLCNREMFIAYA